MDDHSTQQPGHQPFGASDGDMEVAFYPERMARSGDGVTLSPSQAVQYAEDPALREAAAATAGSRQVRQPEALPLLTALWERDTAPLPLLEDTTAAAADDDPFAFPLLAEEPAAPDASPGRPGAAWAGLFGAPAADAIDVMDGDRWTDGAQDLEVVEDVGDHAHHGDDLEVTPAAAPRRRRRALRIRGPRRRVKDRGATERVDDPRSDLSWWEAARPAARSSIWRRLTGRS